MSHDLPTLFQRPDQIADPLYVVIPVINSPRYRSRWRLYEDAARRVADSGAILYTVEVAFGARAFAVTSAENPHHIQLRTSSEMWMKEAAVNIAVRHFPPDWKYMAYLDADSHPIRGDWANETLHQLQHYATVQMWSEYHCLDSHYRVVNTNFSLMHAYMAHWPQGTHRHPHRPGDRYHPPKPGRETSTQWPGSPGLAWAWRRDAWEEVGGLLDVCILGSGDSYMANGLLDRLTDDIVSKQFSPGYRRAIYAWQDRARPLLKNVGLVPGLWVHHYHGTMASRQYGTRNQILKATQFTPDLDLKRDWQGLYTLTSRSPALRDGAREYLHARNEDQQ